MEHVIFREDKIFSYDRLGKVVFSLSVIILAAFFILLAVSYFFLKGSDIFIFKLMNAIINHFTFNLSKSTLLGIFYTNAVGGLFFITIPSEVFYIDSLDSGHSLFIILVLNFIGLIISYSLNYLIGLKLSGLSKKLISPKKFYQTKGTLNKYGSFAVFFFNAVPILPSQALSVILGAFRYNKTRFYIFFLLGQIVKYIVITVPYYYF